MFNWGHVDPSLLHQDFRKDVESELIPSPYTYEARYGYRSLAEQDALHQKYLAGGSRAAPAGRSAHNYGLAVDVALLVDGKADWDTSHPGWVWLTHACAKHPRLHSGAAYADYGHIEQVGWEHQAKP